MSFSNAINFLHITSSRFSFLLLYCYFYLASPSASCFLIFLLFLIVILILPLLFFCCYVTFQRHIFSFYYFSTFCFFFLHIPLLFQLLFLLNLPLFRYLFTRALPLSHSLSNTSNTISSFPIIYNFPHFTFRSKNSTTISTF